MVKTRNMNIKQNNNKTYNILTRRQIKKNSLKQTSLRSSSSLILSPKRKLIFTKSDKKRIINKFPKSKMRVGFLSYLPSEKKNTIDNNKLQLENPKKSEEITTIHCNLCKKPVDIKKSEQDWKTLCVSCFLKVKGKIVKCYACNIEFLTIGEKKDNFCYDCSLGINQGIKSSCVSCEKIFYTSPKIKFPKSHCYDCYLKENGVEKKCTTCKTTIYVKQDTSSWKKKCYSCYIHNY